jgi:phosphoribosylformimino-5-aminoimidazole carboxamide ribotide isomerase
VRAGKCVRLRQGDFDAETVYDDDPIAVARGFEAAGARWIHMVDLDAARTGDAVNVAAIEGVCAAVSCRVQAGGGVRTVEAAGTLLASGVERVVVGTAAVERPALVEELSAMHPGQVAVGLDARADNDVAVRGWTAGGGISLLDLARRFEDSGASALVVTAIARDGTLTGPDLEQLGTVLTGTSLRVVASGGIGTLGDIAAVRELRAGGRGPAGVIVGTALYEGRFTLEEALAEAANPVG